MALKQPISLPPTFNLFLKHPDSISHMLFVGPPGSGKTTTALSFAAALHGGTLNQFASVLFLNSSDERSLETMRQKVYPFVESRMQSLFFPSSQHPPKVIIFDEAETLTDQAQCSLRPLLQRSTKDVILIFICNSLSHINQHIISKFLCIPFPPIERGRVSEILHKQSPPILDLQFRRGDLRYFKLDVKPNAITEFFFALFHASSIQEAKALCFAPGAPFRDRVSWLLLFLHGIGQFDESEFPLWSALSASETQPYLSDEKLTALFSNLWTPVFLRLTSA